MRNGYRRFFLAAGIAMLASEIWKQAALTWTVGGGSYSLCPRENCGGCGRTCGRCHSQNGKEASP